MATGSDIAYGIAVLELNNEAWANKIDRPHINLHCILPCKNYNNKISWHKHLKGYADEWIKEAEKRGLPNLKATVDAVPAFVCEKNVKALSDMGVLTEVEAHSRCEILIEEYSKTINIEMALYIFEQNFYN